MFRKVNIVSIGSNAKYKLPCQWKLSAVVTDGNNQMVESRHLPIISAPASYYWIIGD